MKIEFSPQIKEIANEWADVLGDVEGADILRFIFDAHVSSISITLARRGRRNSKSANPEYVSETIEVSGIEVELICNGFSKIDGHMEDLKRRFLEKLKNEKTL